MPIRPIALVWMGMIVVLALTVWAIDALVRERYLQARPECSVGHRGARRLTDPSAKDNPLLTPRPVSRGG